MASPAPFLPPRGPEMAVTMATLLIQSGDNEANVFFISMSGVWSQAGEGAFSSQPLLRGKAAWRESACVRTHQLWHGHRWEGGGTWSHQAPNPP